VTPPNESGAFQAFLDPLTPLTCQEGVYLEKFSAAVQARPTRLLSPRDFNPENTMTKPSSVAPIPKIEVIKKGALWEVHWDYQEGPASLILFNRADYLRGYIDGALDILGIDPDCVCCASGVTGTVKRLTRHQADTLYGSLNQLLVPLVEAEFARLERLGALPHVRGAAAKV